MEVHQPISRDRSLGILLRIQEKSRGSKKDPGDPRRIQEIQEGSRGSKGDPFVRRFYISLGRYLLDKSFVLNSNNILIYWYSFTSNELYS
jgi:hypothetical protein